MDGLIKSVLRGRLLWKELFSFSPYTVALLYSLDALFKSLHYF